jgi:predicted dehydrogenase
MIAAIIGFGSIGMRHARILSEMVDRVAVVSERKVDHPLVYATVEDLLHNEQPSYIVIANRTQQHYSTLLKLEQLQYKGIVMVEKPLFDKFYSLDNLANQQCYVGYNLRFHPVIQSLKEQLLDESILSVHAYVGQYLPDWRQSDYRLSYSAKKSEGGGVLRDLSHELDYMNWMLGGWERLVSLGGHNSDLDLDCDDQYTILLKTRRCPNATIHMNYVDRVAQRRIVINTNQNTYIADMIHNTIQINNNVQQFKVERDDTYRSLHEALIDNKDIQTVCNYNQAQEVMKLIEAVERSNAEEKWVTSD